MNCKVQKFVFALLLIFNVIVMHAQVDLSQEQSIEDISLPSARNLDEFPLIHYAPTPPGGGIIPDPTEENKVGGVVVPEGMLAIILFSIAYAIIQRTRLARNNEK